MGNPRLDKYWPSLSFKLLILRARNLHILRYLKWEQKVPQLYWEIGPWSKQSPTIPYKEMGFTPSKWSGYPDIKAGLWCLRGQHSLRQWDFDSWRLSWRFFQWDLFLNTQNNSLRKAYSELKDNIFPFQVPTITDPVSRSVITVDRQTYKLYEFKGEQWHLNKKLK